jgi:hypothetical protein
MSQRTYSQRRKCKVAGCTQHRPRHRPLCWDHWWSLPVELRTEILTVPLGGDQWLAACRRAVAWAESREAAIERTVQRAETCEKA